METDITKAKSFYIKEDCANNPLYDNSNMDTWYFGESDMVLFAENYHQSQSKQMQERIKELEENYIYIERVKKYGRHQHFLGTQQKDLVEFDDWKHKPETALNNKQKCKSEYHENDLQMDGICHTCNETR